MLILFDHSTPAPLASYLAGHTVIEAKDRGWDRLSNGDLLAEAEHAGFDILLTADTGMAYQQNLKAVSYTHLDVYKRQVVVVDTDPQQTLATWWNVREADSPKLAPVSLRELPEKLHALEQAGFTYCFIDTPPALTEQNRQVLRLADLVLIPVSYTHLDVYKRQPLFSST